MYCRNCGTQNSDNANNCFHCGARLQPDVVVMNNGNQTGKRCPHCGCENCQIVSESKTSGGGYGCFSGICGYILLGPLGLLCGLCGNEQTTTNTHFWICPSCGKRFKK